MTVSKRAAYLLLDSSIDVFRDLKLSLYPTGVAGSRLSDPRGSRLADAVPLAGGQSLLAGLNMRLSAPKLPGRHRRHPRLMGHSLAGDVVRLGAP